MILKGLKMGTELNMILFRRVIQNTTCTFHDDLAQRMKSSLSWEEFQKISLRLPESHAGRAEISCQQTRCFLSVDFEDFIGRTN